MFAMIIASIVAFISGITPRQAEITVPEKGLQERVKNDKVYSLTENYFLSMKNRFQPAFDQVVATFSVG